MEVLRSDEIDHHRARMERRPTPWLPPLLPASLADKFRSAIGQPKAYLPDISSTEAEAIPALIEAYDQGLAAPSDEEIAMMVGQLAILFPGPKLSPQEAALRLDLYIDCLGDLPTDILRDAFFAVAKKCRFFPLVAEIRSEAEDAFNRRSGERWALRQLLRRHQGL